MTHQQKIESVYKYVGRGLPQAICQGLKFLPVDRPNRQEPRIQRGRILGPVKNHIWSPKTCFYEIGIGSYPAAGFPTVGGIGFVCYVDQRSSGGGIHRADIERMIVEISQFDSTISPSPRGTPNQGVFRYYQQSGQNQFPIDQAAVDLGILIALTLERLNAL